MSIRVYSLYDSTCGASMRTMYQSNQELHQATEQLSTGKRINSSADDIAGLSLSTQIQKISSANNVMQINTQTGINMLNTADGALSGMSDSLQRIRDLSLQSSNSVYSDSERDMIQKEINELIAEINQSYLSTTFGYKKLFDNEGDITKTTNIQVGSGSDDNSQIQISTYFDLGAMNFSATTVTAARNTVDLVDSKMNFINDMRSKIGSQTNKLEAIVDWQKNQLVEYSKANSIIMDADMAKVKGEETKAQISSQFATTVFQQAKEMNSNLLIGLYNS